MKKRISIILAAAVVLMSAAAVFAEDTAYTLTVNGTEIDLSDLPRAIYESDGHIHDTAEKNRGSSRISCGVGRGDGEHYG